ncbi:unnamed protein product [Schistosoma curassoni]|uniref:ANK_REP_REGION domain-containing protein n=1 Tax=Schistosoma curassoni TaxID=6186 RepID=A0A183KJ18_9TREM|nr:unnamed protein product [Schistosoma curassoni]
MNQYIIPLAHNDPRLFSHVSQAFSLVDLGKRLLDAAKNGDVEEVKNLINNGAPFTTDWVSYLAYSQSHDWCSFCAYESKLSASAGMPSGPSALPSLICLITRLISLIVGAVTSAGNQQRCTIYADASTSSIYLPSLSSTLFPIPPLLSGCNTRAMLRRHLCSCEALLRAGISRDARTKVDRTPLHLAAQEGHADIVELLLRNGADLSAKDMLRMTALHWAAERGHTPVVQMLMRFGADAHLQNKFEMTPLDIAECKQHDDARDAMLNTQYDLVSSVGRMAATNGDIVGANAYILTEEETLVPAAPPADEVTVTATTVEESSNIQDSDISETFSNGGDASNEDEKITTLTKVKSGHSGSNKRIWKTELSENTNVNLHGENSEAQTIPYSLSQSTQADNTNYIPNIKNKPNLSGDILLPLDEDCPRDVAENVEHFIYLESFISPGGLNAGH